MCVAELVAHYFLNLRFVTTISMASIGLFSEQQYHCVTPNPNPSTNKKVTHNATRPITASQIHGSSMQTNSHKVYQELDLN